MTRRYIQPDRDTFFTWCEGCDRWMTVMDYFRHLQLTTMAHEAGEATA